MNLNNATNAPYEENTFVPTVSGSVDAGVGTYTKQAGFWFRIGVLVYIAIGIDWTAHTGSGSLLVTNLPFACRNTTNFDPEFIVNLENITIPPNIISILGFINPGESQINFEGIKTAAPSELIDLESDGTLHITGWYVK